MNKDNFCVVPWIHLNTEPNGTVKPCCAYFGDKVGDLKDNSLEEIWNNDKLKEIRRTFLRNEIPKGCASCSIKEESGGHSYRIAMTEKFKHHLDKIKSATASDGTYKTFELLFWDFRFSNICNFKCRMCGHGCSSSWFDDFSDIDKKIKVKFLDKSFYGTDLMKYVDQFIDSVEEIYFAGGEPLLMSEHYHILDKLIAKERYDVRLRYNTNMSTLKYKDYDLIGVWKKFKHVQIFASIDGIEKNAEYSRFGTDWNKIEENLKLLADSKIDYVIATTINIFSIFSWTQLIDKLIELKISTRRIILSHVSYPEYYKTSLLPEDLKEMICNQLDQHLKKITASVTEVEYNWLINLYNEIKFYLFLTNTSEETLELRKKFKRQTVKLDNIRKENIRIAVPELAEWFDKI